MSAVSDQSLSPPSEALGERALAGEDKVPVVWISVVNWNGLEDTLTCISSLRGLDYPAFRIVITDNGSTDGSPEQLRRLEGVDLLLNDTNRGFGAGHNRGMEYAFEHGADYVLVLNNDTVVDPQLVTELVNVAQTDPRIGLAAPMIFCADLPERVWFSGMHFRYGLYVVRRALHLRKNLSPAEDVDFVSGCAMLLSRDLCRTVGMFDTQFHIYYEDLDLCIRAAQAGYRIVCATQARMWHAESASFGGLGSPLRQSRQVKSTFLFCRKHTRGLTRAVTVSLRLAHAGWMALRELLHGRLPRQEIQVYLKARAAAVREVRSQPKPAPNVKQSR